MHLNLTHLNLVLLNLVLSELNFPYILNLKFERN